jgi:hypothetical protein
MSNDNNDDNGNKKYGLRFPLISGILISTIGALFHEGSGSKCNYVVDDSGSVDDLADLGIDSIKSGSDSPVEQEGVGYDETIDRHVVDITIGEVDEFFAYDPCGGMDDDCDGVIDVYHDLNNGPITEPQDYLLGAPLILPIVGQDNSKNYCAEESISPDTDPDSKIVKLSQFRIPPFEEISGEKLDQLYDKLMDPNFDPDDEE